jgi:hypothetical protein
MSQLISEDRICDSCIETPTVQSATIDRLNHSVQPYKLLHKVWWMKLIQRTGPSGWVDCLVQTYFAMKASSPLLLFAAERATALGDQRLNAYVEWCHVHEREEVEHHNWLLEDLRLAGVDANRLATSIANDTILQLVGVQFALMATAHPTALLGYLFIMECQPSAPRAVSDLAADLGIPRTALRTLLFHTEADQEHKIEVLKFIASYAADPLCFDAILAAAVHTLRGWTEFFCRRACQIARGSL